MARSTQPRKKFASEKRPLTKAMLLPMPASEALAISLENHLALVTMRTGHGNTDVASCLLRAVYIAYLLHEAAPDCIAPESFLEAENALMQSIHRAVSDEKWSLSDGDCAILESILTLHDQQHASTPAHRIVAAHKRLRSLMAGSHGSPIAIAGTL